MMLDKKQIQVIFFFFNSNSKWVVKHRRQPATPTTHWVQELLGKVQCSGDSRSPAKETRALKMRSAVTSHWKLRAITEADSLRTTQEVAKEFNAISESERVSLVAQLVKNLPAVQETWV